MVEIVVLDAAEAERRLDELAAILVDAVEGGASVSFMLPFPVAAAGAFWRRKLDGIGAGTTVLLVAQDEAGKALGTVLLELGTPPNQPHRADIAKLLVHRAARQRGCGRALMERVEREAKQRGRALLVLDTANAAAERLYARLGWQRVGSIPGFALLPGGELCDTVIFWKQLSD